MQVQTFRDTQISGRCWIWDNSSHAWAFVDQASLTTTPRVGSETVRLSGREFPAPQKIYRVEGLMPVISVEAQRPHVDGCGNWENALRGEIFFSTLDLDLNLRNHVVILLHCVRCIEAPLLCFRLSQPRESEVLTLPGRVSPLSLPPSKTYLPFVLSDEPQGYAHPVPLIQSAEDAVSPPPSLDAREWRTDGKERLENGACSEIEILFRFCNKKQF
ncbi:hypothetical protein TNCV_1834411 [Trichonephila clavipes]|nr:hypothetical protein TNCV_1834411 [Trichonephila clavipes]